MFQYQVSEPNEEPNQTVILKSGGVVKFTPQHVKDNIAHARKQKTEIETMWRVAEASKKNIAATDPGVLKLSERELLAAYLYREQIGIATECAKKLQEINDAIAEDEQALRDAALQTGLPIGPDPVPEQEATDGQ